MVPPLTNRKRGKTREQRTRDARRLQKTNAKAAGKIKAPAVGARPKGSKKIKKKEQRLRLLAKSHEDKMEE
jgi:hypothetical protein